MNQLLDIEPFNLKTIEGLVAEQMNVIWNAARTERMPDDPPVPLAEDLQGWRNIPEFVEVHEWLAWNPEHTQAVGVGEVEVYRTEDNQHMAFFDIYVLPELRRQGLGRELLATLMPVVTDNQRRLMMASTYHNIPAGEAFMQRLGGTRGLEQRLNQLRLSELDRGWVEKWSAAERYPGYELGLWEGSFQEEQMETITELFRLTNEAPREQLDYEDRQITVEQVRDMERYQLARGHQRWTMYIIDHVSGRFAGFTEVLWNPNRPDMLTQGFTGVHPDFRGHSLGRWLKAAMIDKVLRERPQVKIVRTGNANSNVPMLKINTEMGFKLAQAATIWQVETEKVLAYLREY